ncbi:VWA domain-containing protein, partial [Planctomycetota bacterium]
ASQQAPINIPAMKRALFRAGKVLTSSNSTYKKRAEVIAEVSDYNDINTALFLLNRLSKLSKSVQYRWFISQTRYTLLHVEALEMERAFAKYTDSRIVDMCLMNIKKLDEVGKLTLLQGLKACPSKILDEYYFRLLNQSRKHTERILAIDAAGFRKLEKALPLLHGYCANEKMPFAMRCASIRALARMARKESIEYLAGCLKANETRKGRIFWEAYNALWTITGKQFASVKEMEEWWKENKQTFIPPEKPTLHFNAEMTGQHKWDMFYGIPIVGNRIMFVLDRSGSMQGDKIDGVQKEVKRIAVELGEEKYFNIMFFNQGTELWCNRKPFIFKAMDSAKHGIDSFLLSVTASGGTATEVAMQKTLTSILPEADLDTVILLSDGLPNNDPYFVQYSIYQTNRYLKARIHTIYINDPGMGDVNADSDSLAAKSNNPSLLASQLMDNIARTNDGLFKNITPQQAQQGGGKK